MIICLIEYYSNKTYFHVGLNTNMNSTTEMRPIFYMKNMSCKYNMENSTLK